MKFRRRPVACEIVDAIKDESKGEYLILGADGLIRVEQIGQFERDFEPVRRERKAKTPRRKKGQEGTAT